MFIFFYRDNVLFITRFFYFLSAGVKIKRVAISVDNAHVGAVFAYFSTETIVKRVIFLVDNEFGFVAEYAAVIDVFVHIVKNYLARYQRIYVNGVLFPDKINPVVFRRNGNGFVFVKRVQCRNVKSGILEPVGVFAACFVEHIRIKFAVIGAFRFVFTSNERRCKNNDEQAHCQNDCQFLFHN